jgi:hypothetical protein
MGKLCILGCISGIFLLIYVYIRVYVWTGANPCFGQKTTGLVQLQPLYRSAQFHTFVLVHGRSHTAIQQSFTLTFIACLFVVALTTKSVAISGHAALSES